MPTKVRFIPTCVGLIDVFSCLVLRKSVHPHVRGVNAGIKILIIRRSGSSPRAWG